MSDLMTKNDSLDKYNNDIQINTHRLFENIIQKSNDNDQRIIEQIQKMNDARDIKTTMDSITAAYNDKRQYIDDLKLSYIKKLHGVNHLSKLYSLSDHSSLDSLAETQKQNII